MNNKNFYCTVLIKRYGSIRNLVVKRLNNKGLKTKRGNDYTFSVVNNVLAGMYRDGNVEEELQSLAYEAGYTDEQIGEFEKSLELIA